MHLNLDEVTIQEFNLKNQVGFDFWHTNIMDKTGKPISAGFGDTKDFSRAVAYSEYLERCAFLKIKSGDEIIRNKWGLNIIPTGCGFAAGFNLKNTIQRSIGEAIERWTMSKWIDDSLFIEKIEYTQQEEFLDPVTRWFCSEFDKVDFYKKIIVIQYNQKFLKYEIGFTMAYKDNGIYPGSAYNYLNLNLWQHAMLESYRHYLVIKNNSATNTFPDNKVRFFAENSNIAKNQILNAVNLNWPIPEIEFHANEFDAEKQFHLSRTIVKGWKSWNLGPIERFLY